MPKFRWFGVYHNYDYNIRFCFSNIIAENRNQGIQINMIVKECKSSRPEKFYWKKKVILICANFSGSQNAFKWTGYLTFLLLPIGICCQVPEYLKKLEYRFYVYFAKKNLWPIVTVVIQRAKNFELIVHGKHGFFSQHAMAPFKSSD